MIAAVASGSGTKEENKLSGSAERFCRRFSLAEIQLATEDFSEAHLIGTGGFGKVYKGQIDSEQQTVAIKRLAPNSHQGEGEFLTEIETLSKLRHVNLVSLIGYCNENEELILVYEYIPHGTLASHLYKLSRSSESDNCLSLTWKQRLNICVGAGRGLDYLHTGTSIVHRDVKSTNILLDVKFTAKVSDFGLAKHFTSNSKSHVSTIVKGTFGYLDPSYFATCRLTRKSDIYAFGVVLLEVLCGRPALDQRLGEDQVSLVTWARVKISKGKTSQIVASTLRDEISPDCLKTFVGIAKRCLNHEPEKRPTMAQVVVQLEFALQQQDRDVPTLSASRFLSFWNRVKPSDSRATAIPIHELRDITDNFSSECLIHNRYDGNVYRGTLKSGQDSAIKELYFSSQPDELFLRQVSLVSSLKHENLAQLLGYCLDGGRKFLAYEFAQNGSLHDILHGFYGSKPVPALSWAQRVKIAIGAAKGLEYIHEKTHIHYDIRSCNVLVYNDQVVKLAGFFGLPTHFAQKGLYDCGDYHPSAFMRPHHYYAPEYILRGKVSCRGNVYSFGWILLELLTGGKLFDHTRPRLENHLPEWARLKLREDELSKLMDVRLNGDYPPDAVAKMAAVASLCVQREAELRPDMSTVVRALRHLLKDCSATET